MTTATSRPPWPKLGEFEVGVTLGRPALDRLIMKHLPCGGVVTTPAYSLTDLETLTRLAVAHRCPR